MILIHAFMMYAFLQVSLVYILSKGLYLIDINYYY